MVTPPQPRLASSAPHGGALFSPAAPPRLLLMVGDEEERRILGWTLEAAGALVTDGADLEEGLAALAAGAVDLVLVDAGLPDADRVMAGARGSGVPVGVLGGTEVGPTRLPRPYTWAELSGFVLRLCAPPQAATSRERLPGV